MEGMLPYFVYSILSLACIASIITLLIQRIYSKKKDEDYLFDSSMTKQPLKHGHLTSVKIPSMQIHVAPISVNETSRRDSSDVGEQPQGRGLLASTSTSSEDDSTQNTKWRVWFQIHYKDMDGCLEVAIFRVKAVNGQPESLPSKLSENFFFVVCVLPEESTKVQTRTCSVHESAAFHDTVYLKISKTDFYDRAIRISMYKVNDVKQRMCCGHTMVKLGLLDFDRCETYYFCNELDSLAKVMTKSRGEMHLSLGYDHKKERLAAQVFAARCLPETSAEQKFYMKTIVTVGRRRVKVDCGELCNSLSGIFKCSYSFHIPPRWLQSCSIQFLICEVRNGSERRWGHVVVGSCRYAHGTGLEHWNEMTNQQPKIIEMWHMIRHG
ncbi:Synaptotagmin-12 [Trichinella pseudospiralis]|uniref:Synaptotagmin-12 n=1 Tax=Trichinella pseudospiralis TaxID=6337 RepID=A0A0V1ISM1_TRIPS|nr:Synaptotagmin-12 [Trichinella pseudospiralis]KRZ25795.1 Synaptotagmin-12 [Trichinella pseudospiralis]KRZ31689.1 Synaptotagmin-12 [Trichinella pseudospiralis]